PDRGSYFVPQLICQWLFFLRSSSPYQDHSKYDSGGDSPSRKASAWTGTNEKGREPPRSRPSRQRLGTLTA
ncbi:MAG: hypothetical protein DMF28_04160, partial [Verrucomicrobia bacterium]